MPTMQNTGKTRTGRIIKDVPQDGPCPPNSMRMLLRKDALVWILEDGGIINPNNPTDVWVRIKNVHQSGNLGPGTQGVVPLNCLELGEYEEKRTLNIFKSHPFTQNVPINNQASSLLERTLSALFRGMATDAERLDDVGFQRELLDRMKKEPDTLAHRIVNCKYFSSVVGLLY